MKRTCKQCGKEFELSESELNFYRKKNLTYPKRCAKCRALNRLQKSGSAQENKAAKTVQQETVIEKQHVVSTVPKKKKQPVLVIGIAVLLVIAVIGSGYFVNQYFGNEQMEYNAVTEPPAVETTISVSEPAENIAAPEEVQTQTAAETAVFDTDSSYSLTDPVIYTFRNDTLLEQHYEKHGIEMGFASAKAYEAAASDVVNDPDALHKTEAEDGDDVYYLEDTNEFVIVSKDGYLRTYFYPSAGMDYYNRQ